MIVTGALNWWNERPEDLDACVRGLGNVVDRVVALDGAYARYPEATPRSPEDQLAAIREAAKAVDIHCVIVQPDTLWAGQVEKRSRLLALASEGSDWIATVDADHVIHTNRSEIRDFLRRATVDVIEVDYVTPANPERNSSDAVGLWHLEQMQTGKPIPHIWRVLPEMQVERFHWWITAKKDGRKVWLWSNEEHPQVEHQMFTRYTVEHRTMMRTSEQIRLSRAFLNDRQKVVEWTGQEDDRPDLPRPSYDYSLVPW